MGLRGYKFQCHARIVSPTAAEQNGQRNFGHFLSFFSHALETLSWLFPYEAEIQWLIAMYCTRRFCFGSVQYILASVIITQVAVPGYFNLPRSYMNFN